MGFFNLFKKRREEYQEFKREMFYYPQPSDYLKEIVDGREGQTIYANPIIKDDRCFIDNMHYNNYAADLKKTYEIKFGYFIREESGGINSSKNFKNLTDCFAYIKNNFSNILITEVNPKSNFQMIKNELICIDAINSGYDFIYIDDRYNALKDNNGLYYLIRVNNDILRFNNYTYNNYIPSYLSDAEKRFHYLPSIYYGALISNGYNWTNHIEELKSQDFQKFTIVKPEGITEKGQYLKGTWFDKNKDSYTSMRNGEHSFIYLNENQIVKSSISIHANTLKSEIRNEKINQILEF